MILELYRSYLRAGEHPAKLRILRWIEKLVFLKGKRLITIREGHQIHVGPDDDVERELLRGGTYEPRTLEFVKENLGKGRTCVCAGTAYGMHLITAAGAVGKEGTVIGIDPQPGSLVATHRNLLANGLRGRVNLVGSALADGEVGFLPMTAPNRNRGSYSFSAQPETMPRDFHAVGRPLSAILDSLGAGQPDLMVLDVEGYEETVIGSFDDQSRPVILVFEVHPWMIKRGHTDEVNLFRLLKEQGYEIRDLGGAKLSPGDKIDEYNAVAFLPDRGEPTWIEVVAC